MINNFKTIFVIIFISFTSAYAQSPGAVTGNILWLKADVGAIQQGTGTAADGDSVTTWTDQTTAEQTMLHIPLLVMPQPFVIIQMTI